MDAPPAEEGEFCRREFVIRASGSKQTMLA